MPKKKPETFPATLDEQEVALQVAAKKSPAYHAMLYRNIKNQLQENRITSYSFNGFRFLWEIHNDPAHHKVIKKAAQIGATEAVMNIVFWAIDALQRDCLYVLPTDSMASEISAARFDAALLVSPHLANLFSHVSNVGHKRSGMTNLYMVGANTKDGLRTRSASVLILDERDRMTKDKVLLAQERLGGAVDAIQIDLSTPSVPNYGIDEVFQKSTWGLFMVKCPRCSKWSDFTLRSLQWDGEDPNTGEIICTACHGEFTHQSRLEAIEKGHWDHQFPDREMRGWQVPRMLSPMKSAKDICEKWKESLTDKMAEQEFYNSTLGLAHLVEGSQLSPAEILRCVGDYPMANRADSIYCTMGVDVGTWLHIEIATWLNNLKKVIWIGKVKEFEELDKFYQSHRIRMAVIDMGPETRKSRDFVARHPGQAFMCRYLAGGQPKELLSLDEEAQIAVAARTEMLDITLERYRKPKEQVVLPMGPPQEYIDQLCAQARVYEPQGGVQVAAYRETGPDDYGHAANYNEVAGIIFKRHGGALVLGAKIMEVLGRRKNDRMTAHQDW